MKKEHVFSILIIVGVISIVGIYAFSEFTSINDVSSQSDIVNVGDAKFTLPENYVETTLNKDNDTTIENNSDKLYLSECDNIEKEMSDYLEYLESKDVNVISTSFKVNDVTVYKVDVNGSSTTHYWFELNNKGYTIYSWNRINNLDIIVTNLINSAISND